jgi:hypothetical protein
LRDIGGKPLQKMMGPKKAEIRPDRVADGLSREAISGITGTTGVVIPYGYAPPSESSRPPADKSTVPPGLCAFRQFRF